MIRINLLKGPHAKPRRERRGMGKILVAVAVVAVVVAAGGAVWMFRSSLFPKAPPAEKQEIAVKPEAASSAYAKPGVSEDVVKGAPGEGTKPSADSMVNLPYDELSFSEKIDYEVLFAKNVVELLGKVVPAGIGLRSLESDNFQTVYAEGMAPSRELVEGMFAALKAEKVTLLPKPLTQITANGGGTFKFAFTGKVEFGLNIYDSIVGAPIPFNSDLARVVASFDRVARENSITITNGLSHVSSKKTGAYYRHLYRWSAAGSYENFAEFIVRLHRARQFCAFKRISVTAVTGANVRIESQIIVITRE